MISMEEYTPVICTRIRAGFAIKLTQDGLPGLLSAHPTKPGEWGFKAAALRVAVQELTWPENELMNMLSFGGHDYSSDKPPVSLFSPYSYSVFKHWLAFSESVRKEIR